MAQERCLLRYSSCLCPLAWKHHPVTCHEFANHLSLHVKNNVEPDSCEVGARSPQDKHSSTVASLHHQNRFCWLPTQKTGPRKGIEKVGSRTMRKLGSQSKPKYRGTPGTWDLGGLSPHLLCWRKSSVHICLQYSLGSHCNRAALALPLAQLCKASSETVK